MISVTEMMRGMELADVHPYDDAENEAVCVPECCLRYLTFGTHSQWEQRNNTDNDEQATTTTVTVPQEKEKEANLLKTQNVEIQEQKLVCKMCFDNDVTTLFLPCSHLACCAKCSQALDMCPICKLFIKETVKIFLDWTTFRKAHLI